MESLTAHYSPTSGPTSCLSGDFEGKSRRRSFSIKGTLPKSIPYADSDNVAVDQCAPWAAETLHWNAVTLRYAPQDFRKNGRCRASRKTGRCAYEELAPYYERVEEIIGVCGDDDGLKSCRRERTTCRPPLAVQRTHHEAGHECDGHSPHSGAQGGPVTRPYDHRPPCHYCGHCMDGCDVAAIFSTPDCTLPKARATGNFTLRQNALAREILMTAKAARVPSPT